MAAAGKEVEKSCQRPALPRPGLSKGRQHSTGSMSIKFTASTSDDDKWHAKDRWDESGLEFGLDARELLVSQSILQDVDICSKSAPVSEVTTPDPETCPPELSIEELSPVTAFSITNQLRVNQNLTPLPPPPSSVVLPDCPDTKVVSTERSFISGIKERIQGMQDPLQAFTGKIEDFIVEKGIMDPRKSRRAIADSGELKGSTSLQSSAKQRSGMDGVHSPSEVLEANSGLETAMELEDMARMVTNQTTDELSRVNSKPDTFVKHRPASFDLSGDFYEVDAADYLDAPIFEDAGQFGLFPKSCSMDTISQQLAQSAGKESPKKIKATLQKLIQPIAGRSASSTTKPAISNQNVTMTLSGLLNSNAIDGEEVSISAENEHFCDAQDGPVSPSRPQTPSSESSSKLPPDGNVPVGAAMTDGFSPPPKKMTSYPLRQNLLAFAVVVLAYIVVPLPAYIAGMISGASLAAIVIFAYLWWTSPPKMQEPFILPDLSSLPPLEVPEMKESKNHDNEFKGWMNELLHYDKDDYHIGHTHSVLVHLEGTKLRLQTPKYNIPKRAFWDEPSYHSSVFIRQRHYDLRGARVLLVPENLVKKRLWSKKYPICLIIQRSVSPASPDVSEGTTECVKIFLFARCTRDKEEWFRRFEAAAAGKPLPTQLISVLASGMCTHRRMSSSSSLDAFVMNHKRQSSADSNISDPGKETISLSYCDSNHEKRLTSYLRYMARVIPSESQQRLQAQAKESSGNQSTMFRLPTAVRCEPQVAWVNALVTRCFLDFLHEEYWVAKIREKIQNKIGKIHIPWFIDDLTVTGCELGSEMPVIRRASKPYIDDRGLWVDLDIAYTGGFRLQLETKCNLMKLKQKPSELVRVPHSDIARSPITDSDEEDSPESSTDEEACEENVEDEKLAGAMQAPTGGTSGKILRFVDKITQSKYFHKATEYKYIKKAMEGVSNTRLLLVVEVKNIAGTLAINIPPPPTDRLWYGFRSNPRLWLSVKPWVGEREVSLTHVTDWIEKKLAVEFQRVFVMPNMDDIPIPVMCDHLTPETSKDEMP